MAAGDALLAPSVTRRLVEEFAGRPEVERDAPSQLWELTAREREVLDLMPAAARTPRSPTSWC